MFPTQILVAYSYLKLHSFSLSIYIIRGKFPICVFQGPKYNTWGISLQFPFLFWLLKSPGLTTFFSSDFLFFFFQFQEKHRQGLEKIGFGLETKHVLFFLPYSRISSIKMTSKVAHTPVPFSSS